MSAWGLGETVGGVSSSIGERRVEAKAWGWEIVLGSQGDTVGYLGEKGGQGRFRCWSGDAV